MAKRIPWMQQQRYTASAAAAPALHSSNGTACSTCWGRRLFPKFWGALCMQSTLAGALLLANSLQLVVKALPRGAKTEHACTSMHQHAPTCTSVHQHAPACTNVHQRAPQDSSAQRAQELQPSSAWTSKDLTPAQGYARV